MDCSSGGAEGPEELENSEPPSRGFFLPALSRSACFSAMVGVPCWEFSYHLCGLQWHLGLRVRR